MNKWPNKKDVEDILNELDKDESIYSKVTLGDASASDLIKRDMCAEFIIYRQKNNINQRELAQRIEISEALISKILRYRFEEFTIDRLVNYLGKIGVKYEFKRVA